MTTQAAVTTYRTDPHSPTNFDPANYEYVGTVYFGTSEEAADALADPEADKALEERGWKGGNFAIKGTCDHCGARFKYGVVYNHRPTNEVIVVGHDCARERFSFNSRMEYDIKALRDRVAAARELSKKKALMAKFALKYPDLADLFKVDHNIIRDIASRYAMYGEISEAQVALVRKIANEVAEREAREIERLKNAIPIPNGRMQVTGVIISVKWQESDYGTTLKMLVQRDDGSRLWGSVPSSLGQDNLKQRRVRFTATLEQSKDDKFFGFFSRPAKADFTDNEEYAARITAEKKAQEEAGAARAAAIMIEQILRETIEQTKRDLVHAVAIKDEAQIATLSAALEMLENEAR